MNARRFARTASRLAALLLALGLMVSRLPAAPVSASHPLIPRGPDCSEQCIESFTVTPHGTNADFDIHLDKGVKQVRIEAHEDGKMSVDTKYDYTGNAEIKTFLINMQPNTKYLYTVRATDRNGNVYEPGGSFKTLHRDVTVTYTDIHVLAEGDETQQYYFNTGYGWDYAAVFSADIAMGGHANPNYSTYIPNAPETLSLQVFGWDDNCDDLFDGLCPEGIASPGNGTPAHGSTSAQDWTTASLKPSIGPSGLVENKTLSLVITSPAYPLQFTVQVTIEVTYIQ